MTNGLQTTLTIFTRRAPKSDNHGTISNAGKLIGQDR